MCCAAGSSGLARARRASARSRTATMLEKPSSAWTARACLSCECSMRQPDLRHLWNSSMLQRCSYQRDAVRGLFKAVQGAREQQNPLDGVLCVPDAQHRGVQWLAALVFGVVDRWAHLHGAARQAQVQSPGRGEPAEAPPARLARAALWRFATTCTGLWCVGQQTAATGSANPAPALGSSSRKSRYLGHQR
jgi:hypothetical protein